jgi:hypothetical protein
MAIGVHEADGVTESFDAAVLEIQIPRKKLPDTVCIARRKQLRVEGLVNAIGVYESNKYGMLRDFQDGFLAFRPARPSYGRESVCVPT